MTTKSIRRSPFVIASALAVLAAIAAFVFIVLMDGRAHGAEGRRPSPIWGRGVESLMGTFAAGTYAGAYRAFRYTCRFLEEEGADNTVQTCASAALTQDGPLMFVTSTVGRVVAVSVTVNVMKGPEAFNANAIDSLMALFLEPQVGEGVAFEERLTAARRSIIGRVLAAPRGERVSWGFPNALVRASITGGDVLHIDIDKAENAQ